MQVPIVGTGDRQALHWPPSEAFGGVKTAEVMAPFFAFRKRLLLTTSLRLEIISISRKI
jgi:hypothetical protein